MIVCYQLTITHLLSWLPVVCSLIAPHQSQNDTELSLIVWKLTLPYYRKETPLKPAVASKPSLKGGGRSGGGKGEEGSKGGEQQGEANSESKGSSSRSSSVAKEPETETRLRGRLGGGQVNFLPTIGKENS